ncbi:MAG: hypothetical protein AB9Q22_10275 [Candidatus Reddybacter sp.]
MTIGTNTVVDFFGTPDDLASSSAAVADAAFSIASDVAQWTNDDDAEMASIVLSGTWAVAPDAGGSVALYARLMNIDGTGDQDIPSANYRHKSLGRFPVKDVTSAQLTAIDIDLPNNYSSQVYEFYIQNNAGQTISAGWKLVVTPKAPGAHA